jgi:hypothetical protein
MDKDMIKKVESEIDTLTTSKEKFFYLMSWMLWNNKVYHYNTVAETQPFISFWWM